MLVDYTPAGGGTCAGPPVVGGTTGSLAGGGGGGKSFFFVEQAPTPISAATSDTCRTLLVIDRFNMGNHLSTINAPYPVRL